jgi:chromosomal replication initiator protein
VQSNIRELEGALNRILAFADLSGSPLTTDLVNIALADLLPQRADIKPHQIVSEVANYYELTTEKLVSRDRSRNIARPRQIAMYLLREEIDVSLPQIGEVLGGRDHTTVMHAVDKIEKIIKGDPSSKIARDIMKITDRLRNQQGQAVL